MRVPSGFLNATASLLPLIPTRGARQHLREMPEGVIGGGGGQRLRRAVDHEEREADAGGERVTRQLDKIWTKYTGNPPPYGLRDPAIDEKRVLFVCNVDRIATFGKP